MRIALESQELLAHRLSGVGRYAGELGRCLTALEPGTDQVLPLSRIGKILRIRRNGLAWPTWSAPPVWPLKHYDILHLTSDRDMAVPGRPKRIVTVHDLWEHAQVARGDLPGHTRSWERLCGLLASADATICVSAHTQRDLRRIFPQVTGPSTVIHHGASPVFTRAADPDIARMRRDLLGGIADYLLYVGHFHERKNIPRMIAAYATLPPESTPPLVLAGNTDAQRTADIRALARRLNIADHRLICLDYLGDPDLVALISGARGVLFVPLFEGFGLPLVEAYRCGAPVVVAATSSLVELAHPASPQVDPEAIDSIAGGITRLLAQVTTPELRASLIAHGQRFTWERCARETLAFYRSVLGG